MKIVNINTKNKIITRDMLIKAAIKADMQYVEMDDELLVEDTLFRINEIKDIYVNCDILETLNTNLGKKQFFTIDKQQIEYKPSNFDIELSKKDILKRNSRLVKTKINKNGYYKKRGK